MEIKFRAWIEDRFIYPTTLTVTRRVVYVYDSEADYTYQIERNELQRYTGKNDVNGVPIFEGDIVKAKVAGEIVEGEVGIDSWGMSVGSYYLHAIETSSMLIKGNNFQGKKNGY